MSAAKHAIQLQNISFHLPNGQTLFQNINLTLPREKIGIIGKNGSGKTTFCKLLTGELLAEDGKIIRHNLKLAACPQTYEKFLEANNTVAEILGIQDALYAYHTILNVCLRDVPLEKPFAELSGGQRTAVLLTKYFNTDADFLLLDEPTNNLDRTVRNALYQAIEKTDKGLFIVSHDRQLLDSMDKILEITSLGIRIYGGNYSFYKEQKTLMSEAARHEYADAKKLIQSTNQKIQINRERHEQKQAYGKRLKKNKVLDKIVLGGMKGRSERTQSDLLTKSTRLIKNAEEIMVQAKAKIEIIHEFDFDLAETFVPPSKLVLSMENIVFAYEKQPFIINNFNLTVHGPQRIAFVGDNGSGKSTLVKLILGELIPAKGVISIGVSQVNYLDQQCSQLNPDLSVLDNFLIFNPDYSNRDAHFVLADFLFRNKEAEKTVRQLSGGEKLRALLACVLFSKRPPQLLILDEPTNHLDLESIECIENALKLFEGALILVSHDQVFLENCGVKEYIRF